MEVDVNELDSEELGRRLIPKPETASKISSNGKLDVASSRDDAAIDDSGCETTSNLTLEIRKKNSMKLILYSRKLEVFNWRRVF